LSSKLVVVVIIVTKPFVVAMPIIHHVGVDERCYKVELPVY